MANSTWDAEPTDVEQPLTHHEASWVAFCNNIYIGGRAWNITIREGLGIPDIETMVERIIQVNSKLDAFDPPPGPSEAFGRPDPARNGGDAPSVQPKPTEMPPRASGHTAPPAGEGMFRIHRIMVGGQDPERPVVQMWENNPNLRFPSISPNVNLVIQCLERRYGEIPDLVQRLSVFGYKKERLDWQVYWRVSPKNEKWRDLVDIVIPALEPGE